MVVAVHILLLSGKVTYNVMVSYSGAAAQCDDGVRDGNWEWLPHLGKDCISHQRSRAPTPSVSASTPGSSTRVTSVP